MNALAVPAPVLDTGMPLSARGIHLAYGCHEVLRGIELDVPQGEVLALVGRNGAGKSSLIGCLLGLLRPQAGEARVMGAPALALDEVRKARLGYVPQQPQAFSWMKVGQLFDYLSQLYPDWDPAHAAGLLRRWDIDPSRPIGKLSPGQAQRLAMARALAPRPWLLVLEEPASALDPGARRELLRELVTQAMDSGTTVLFSSHIVSDLERVASRVAFLQEGRLLLDRALDEVKDEVVRIHVPAAAAARVPAALPGELVRRQTAGGELQLVVAGRKGWQDLLLVEGVRVDRLGLEDLFIEVAG
ncbi:MULTISPECIES: ABC transporter ATP-binding protein [Pseudoxanthomonas]|uniref:ABC-2 type transport system ATP-binding protein n=1 Tax=Pseudoxanthomonas taiwanensis J19 TaxID=935569 RepID=A0A562D9P0_9GAMM|nr:MULTISPECIES: ABC transporter ATP-binding protein [Pseudoxanthomonas]RRN80696.1 ABC transporter ATP-binding protein [Pseudoxanthomonas sp. SGD-10]TWH06333.1 ABC-2 type transport system ATP-binding protein [Pseudoxanthomonas taiwanensis J19]